MIDVHDVVYDFGTFLPICLFKRVLAFQARLLIIIVVSVVGLNVYGVSVDATVTIHQVLGSHLKDRFVLS